MLVVSSFLLCLANLKCQLKFSELALETMKVVLSLEAVRIK